MAFDISDIAATGPGTLAGRYLRHYWQPIHVAKDLPARRAKPVRILGEDFTLYRGESGTPYLVASRCAHRNTVLRTGWVRGESIRCLYHGWTFDGDGQCVDQPSEPQPFCSKVRIRACPTEEYLGLIFAYLGEGDPPPLPRYDELENHGEPYAFRMPDDTCNWLPRFDQMGDVVHAFFTHPQLLPGLTDLDAPRLRVEETTYGLALHCEFPNGWRQTGHFHMPNGIEVPRANSNLKSMFWFVPIDDDNCASFAVAQVPPEGAEEIEAAWKLVQPLGDAILRGDMTIDDLVSQSHPPSISVAVQDYVVIVGQGSLDGRPRDRLGQSDAGTIAVRKLWEQELTALDQGRALTVWHGVGGDVFTAAAPPKLAPA